MVKFALRTLLYKQDLVFKSISFEGIKKESASLLKLLMTKCTQLLLQNCEFTITKTVGIGES